MHRSLAYIQHRLKETADGLVVDFDDAGHVVGIDIQHASQRIDLSSIKSKHLPLINQAA